MKLWRLVIDLNPGVWTIVAVAEDAFRAWRCTLDALHPSVRARASLEELERRYEVVQGPARVVRAWAGPGAPRGRKAARLLLAPSPATPARQGARPASGPRAAGGPDQARRRSRPEGR
ncbi:MAG: hypothetical protein D6731_01285 [Planctomycetota bacterium]|nr:MAG: hypothetical protein D6731_01285 [Planctomycetota bacterium]